MKIAISENIKRLRKEKNITQAELAAKFGTTCQSVCRWENGATYPDIELIPEIAAFFGVSTDMLLGCDNESVESKINKVCKLADQDNGMDIKDKIVEMRKVMADLPYEPRIKHHILRQYYKLGFEESTKNISELREFAEFICSSDADFWIKYDTRNIMTMIESDEEAAMRWSEQMGSEIITRTDALLSRYRYRKDIDKFNGEAQKNLCFLLTKLFASGFQKLNDDEYYLNDSEYYKLSRITILKIIDIFRDPSTDIDAWISLRSMFKFQLASAHLRLGEVEECYVAIEEAVDLLVKIAELPEDAVIKYNTPLIGLVEFDKFRFWAGMKQSVDITLINPLGEREIFKSISDTDRYKAAVERITKYLE